MQREKNFLSAAIFENDAHQQTYNNENLKTSSNTFAPFLILEVAEFLGNYRDLLFLVRKLITSQRLEHLSLGWFLVETISTLNVRDVRISTVNNYVHDYEMSDQDMIRLFNSAYTYNLRIHSRTCLSEYINTFCH
jgi:hypothetical protein